MRQLFQWHSYAIVMLSIACAATPAPDRAKELAACQLISKSGDELARCLIMKYSWVAESAGPAKSTFQWQLDSIRRDHEEQAAVVLAEQRARIRAEQQRLALRTAPWVQCVLNLGFAAYEHGHTCGRLPTSAELDSYIAVRNPSRGETDHLIRVLAHWEEPEP